MTLTLNITAVSLTKYLEALSLQVWGYKVCKRYYALRELKKLIEVAEKLREKRWP
ncbi:hypothetical protein YC2023_016704 [Brassica napus]